MKLVKWLELLMLVAAVTAKWEKLNEDNKPRILTCLKFQGPLAYVDCRATFHIKPEGEKFKFRVPRQCDGDIMVDVNDIPAFPIKKIKKPLEITITMDGDMTFDDSARKPDKYRKEIVPDDESGTVEVYIGNMDDCKLEILKGVPMFDNPNSTAVKKPSKPIKNLPEIIAGVLGGVVTMGIVVSLLYYYCYKKDKDREERDQIAERLQQKRSKELK